MTIENKLKEACGLVQSGDLWIGTDSQWAEYEIMSSNLDLFTYDELCQIGLIEHPLKEEFKIEQFIN